MPRSHPVHLKCAPLATLQLGPERFQAPEVLFDPSIIGDESPGVHAVINDAVRKTDIDLRRTLYSNIVLSGGSTLFEGAQQHVNARADCGLN